MPEKKAPINQKGINWGTGWKNRSIILAVISLQRLPKWESDKLGWLRWKNREVTSLWGILIRGLTHPFPGIATVQQLTELTVEIAAKISALQAKTIVSNTTQFLREFPSDILLGIFSLCYSQNIKMSSAHYFPFKNKDIRSAIDLQFLFIWDGFLLCQVDFCFPVLKMKVGFSLLFGCTL